MNIPRRVTRKGVKIQGAFFSAPELADLVGDDLVVEVPQGPLPKTLRAAAGSRLLTLRSIRG
ncbi:MAG: Mu transposase C-terminal domain-containing protein [Magnetospirillum sp.]|nr:Mu transposase C-terminal domain-containing protein [Magnetospirillum sp.]